jgi:hypothetical protein
MSEIVWFENAFDYLVLPAGHKELLASLVSAHGIRNFPAKGVLSSVDLVVGKCKTNNDT